MTDSDTPCGEAAVGANMAEEVEVVAGGEDADEVVEVVAGGEDAVAVQNKQNDCRMMNKEDGIIDRREVLFLSKRRQAAFFPTISRYNATQPILWGRYSFAAAE